ncbi:MAG TPA: multiubiquitin domain-containing protein [Dehalococcoidia bacterium]|nr:multiubiquitin domain-containing protein [Dehalococcoidia bacterium]
MNENTISATGGAAEELEPERDELDIEAFAGLECKPRAKRYIIRIDKKPYVIEKSIVTARELLQIAGKNPPEKFRIWQIIKGESHELALGEKVDVRAPGVEKFRTLSRTQTEG